MKCVRGAGLPSRGEAARGTEIPIPLTASGCCGKAATEGPREATHSECKEHVPCPRHPVSQRGCRVSPPSGSGLRQESRIFQLEEEDGRVSARWEVGAGCRSCGCHWPAGLPEGSDLTSLCLWSLACKMGHHPGLRHSLHESPPRPFLAVTRQERVCVAAARGRGTEPLRVGYETSAGVHLPATSLHRCLP